MPNEKDSPRGEKAAARPPGFTITGRVQQERGEAIPRDVKLQAYVFDQGGRLLGTAEVDERGGFKADVRLAQPAPVEIVLAPPGDPEQARHSAAQRQRVATTDWVAEGRGFLLKPILEIRPDILPILRPVSICVSGHVRKVLERDGVQQACPVAYAKVEIFDVDRESCWWPYLFPRLEQIADLPVLRAADLLKAGVTSTVKRVTPRPVRLPEVTSAAAALADPGQLRVGELKALSPALAAKVENLTLTSLIAPWIYFPGCFYSKTEVCETFTDCNGYFNCCFNWSVLHFRRGRLRLDGRPDIIVRVTQMINGVETVIYMDPYTSTRWNVTNAHIDLYLDQDEVVCGSCAGTPIPGSSKAALLQIGSDEVWKVDQTNGRYKTPPYSNGAYGGSLYLRGNFTADLLTGSPKRYYRLSWAPVGSAIFKPIQTSLSALRSAPGGVFESYYLGPQPPGSPLAGLYEVQDTAHWWLMPGAPGGAGMVLGVWDTSFEADQGAYVLRMEVFDQAGNKINTMQFDRHAGDGTGIDHVFTTVGQLDLTFHIDNKPLEFELETPATNACGVIPWSPAPNLTVHVHAAQENGRVHSWSLAYVKGVTVTRHPLGSGVFNAGIALVEQDVNANALMAGLTSTCAYALLLSATSQVRGNWGFLYYGEKIYAIAIEKCS
jgi:hypothetical protein